MSKERSANEKVEIICFDKRIIQVSLLLEVVDDLYILYSLAV